LTFYYRTPIPKLKILKFIPNLNSSLIFWKMLKLIQLSVLFFGRFPFLYMLVFFFTLSIQNHGFLLAISYLRDKQKIWNKITWLSSIDFWHHIIIFLLQFRHQIFFSIIIIQRIYYLFLELFYYSWKESKVNVLF
jgi:hypothetical protein